MPPSDVLAALRKPFKAEEIGKLPKSTCKDCSDSRFKVCDKHQRVYNCPECHGSHSNATMHLDFVGHADLTARLLEVDPEWSWEPMGTEEHGLPIMDHNGNLWIRLTVGGVTRIGVGDGKNAKECIGDALRNAGMRFGIALDLWAKGDRSWAHAEDETPAATVPEQPPADLVVAALLDEIRSLAGSPAQQRMVASEWAETHGHPLRETTDIGSLELLRDELREKAKA